MDKKEKKAILLLVLIVCLITIIFIIIAICRNMTNSDNIETADVEANAGTDGIETDRGRTEEGQLLLSNTGVISEKYKGTLESSDIREYLENVTKEYIPDLYNDINEYNATQLKAYYEENAEDISAKFGKESYEEFEEFAKKLQVVSVDLETWYKINIIRNTYLNGSDKDGYDYFEYELIFENDETLNFALYVSIKTVITPLYIIDII